MDQSTATLLASSIPGLILIVIALITYLLTIRLEERKVHYSRLYEKQVEVIAELYGLLRDLQSDFKSWLKMYEQPTREEADVRRQLTQSISKKTETLSSYNRRKALWIYKKPHYENDDKIDEVTRSMRSRWSYTVRKSSNTANSSSPDVLSNEVVETVENWLKSLEKTLEIEIFAEFRTLLGADTSQKHGNLRCIVQAVLAGFFGVGLGVLLWILVG